MATSEHAVTLHKLGIAGEELFYSLQSALRKRVCQPRSAFASGVNTSWHIADEILPIDKQQKLGFDGTYCTVSGLRLPGLRN